MAALFLGHRDFQHGQLPATGILLVNLGTPDSPTPPALRRYLRQFLSDPRIIEPPPPRPVWWTILNGIILNVRPAKSARLYQNVWREEGSPLLHYSRLQAEGIQSELSRRRGGPIHVALGMTYGEPSVSRALAELHEKFCRRIVVLPLYPQYSSTTVGSVFDAVAAALMRWRWVPELRFINAYHDDPGYISSVAASIRDHWDEHGEPDKLLLSFHGIPRRYFLAGDPYHCHCHKTARLVREQLNWPEDKLLVCFQSQFGREPWLQPYTVDTLQALAREGFTGRIDAACPGFSSDCLETLEEMNITNREFWIEAGGRDEQYHYIPCLNDRPDHIQALSDLVERQITDWNPTLDQWDEKVAQDEADAGRQRAEALKKTSPNTGRPTPEFHP